MVYVMLGFENMRLKKYLTYLKSYSYQNGTVIIVKVADLIYGNSSLLALS
jgi:hypothetical protein